MTEFTIEQQEVINELGKNLTVSASAGSGKTTVLVARIMKRILVNEVSVDRILAMTFTEAAASEMKKRLAKELNDCLITNTYQGKAVNPDYVNQQLIALQNAYICTIDSFCLSIIKENYAQIGFDIERCSNILSDEDQILYTNQALQQTIYKYATHPEYLRASLYISSKASSTTLNKTILDIASMIKGKNYDEVKQKANDVYEVKALRLLPKNVLKLITQYLNHCLIEIKENLTISLDLTDNDQVRNEIHAKLGQLSQCIELVKEETFDYSLFVSNYKHFVQMPIMVPRGGKINQIDSAYNQSISLLNNLLDEDTILSSLHEFAPITYLLLDMANAFNEAYKKLKEDNHTMDFSDMSYYALQILEKSEDVRKHYRDLFIDIMVDEFQDSSNEQDQLISYITTGNNVFRVGDVKQSIYGFRGAVPALLKHYISHVGENDSVKILNKNFRSNSQIITFVNKLFYNFLNLPGLEGNFDENDVALVGNEEKQHNDSICVEFHSIITDGVPVDDKQEDEVDENDTKAIIRAKYIANLIINDRLKSNGNWKDYVVLVRVHDTKKIIRDAFEEAGIPYFMDSKEGFYKSKIIMDITSYLHFLLEPFEDIYFLAVCASPFYQANDDELAKLYLAKKEMDASSYFEFMMQAKHPILERMKEDYLALQAKNSIIDKLIYLYSIHNVYDTLCTNQERSNLDFLLAKAQAFEKKYPNALHKFVSTVESSGDIKSSEALSHDFENDVVTVMTTHQSKGLQFNKVIYWGKEGNRQSSGRTLAYSHDTSLSFDFYDYQNHLYYPSIIKTALDYETRCRECEEEIRLIYVAFTRAINKLFLVGINKSNTYENLKENDLSSSTVINKFNFLDYLYQMCYRNIGSLTKIIESNASSDLLTIEDKKTDSYLVPSLPETEHKEMNRKASKHKAKLIEWTSVSTDYAAIGTFVHEILEEIDIQKEYTLDDLQDLIHAHASIYVSYVDIRSIEAYLKHPFTKRLAKGNVYHEYPFISQNNGQVTKGYIDMLIVNENEKIIVDYKTDRNATKEDLIERYTEQLKTYKEALEAHTNAPIKTYIYSLSLNDYIEIL